MISQVRLAEVMLTKNINRNPFDTLRFKYLLYTYYYTYNYIF